MAEKNSADDGLLRKSFVCQETENSVKKLFPWEEDGSQYSRISNPTCNKLEQMLASLEGGVGAVVTASGMTAIQLLTMTLLCSGEEIVSSSLLYNATEHLFNGLFKDLGIIVNFADIKNPHSFEAAISPRTRFVFLETISSSGLEVADIRKIADIAHKYKIPLVVDSTYTPPVNYQPINDGADIVIHSLSKWISGHGNAMGGVIIDSGKFDWRTANVPVMKVVDPNSNNIRWAFDTPKTYGPSAFLCRLRASIMRTVGGYLSPDNAWLIMQGIQTLSLRMERHNSNAIAVAKLLKNSEKVAWVRYPGLSDDAFHSIARKQFGNKYGAVLAFALKEDKEVPSYVKACRFIEKFKVCSIEKMPGTLRSSFFRVLSDGQIFFSSGIEKEKDLLDDFTQALCS